MAYRRDLIFETPLLSWQQLTLQSAASEWSDDYRVASPRLLLPSTLAFECRLGPHRFTCDPTSALWLTPAHTYRMRRPWAAQRSTLLHLNAELGRPRRCAVPLSTHLHLGLWAQAWQAGTLEPLALEERLLALAQRTLPADDPRADQRAHRAVERARDFIASAPQGKHTLAQIASAVHCSAFHLARRFRQRTGHSLHGFRTRLRLAAAIARLRDGERDLNTLAADLGFASHSHFSAVFRRHLGMPPSELRNGVTTP